MIRDYRTVTLFLQRKENVSWFPRFSGPGAGFGRSELELQERFNFDIKIYFNSTAPSRVPRSVLSDISETTSCTEISQNPTQSVMLLKSLSLSLASGPWTKAPSLCWLICRRRTRTCSLPSRSSASHKLYHYPSLPELEVMLKVTVYNSGASIGILCS